MTESNGKKETLKSLGFESLSETGDQLDKSLKEQEESLRNMTHPLATEFFAELERDRLNVNDSFAAEIERIRNQKQADFFESSMESRPYIAPSMDEVFGRNLEPLIHSSERQHEAISRQVAISTMLMEQAQVDSNRSSEQFVEMNRLEQKGLLQNWGIIGLTLLAISIPLVLNLRSDRQAEDLNSTIRDLTSEMTNLRGELAALQETVPAERQSEVGLDSVETSKAEVSSEAEQSQAQPQPAPTPADAPSDSAPSSSGPHEP